MKINVQKSLIRYLLISVVFVFALSYFFVFSHKDVEASTISVSPAGGTFVAGSTFDVALLLNTEGKEVNAIEVYLSFPADKLQLVSPTVGGSIISLWTSPPQFDNGRGTVTLKGGIPNGINVSSGVITNLRFRVRGVGSAFVRGLDNSEVYLNDGRGTADLRQFNDGVYGLVLPPPAGPIVASQTHPDQTLWYSNPNVVLNWTHESDVAGYSYIISRDPTDTPDDTSQGGGNSVTYRELAEGRHYFHIKAFRNGSWGGVTSFAINIDTEPPVDFNIEVSPSTRTTSKNIVINFFTTDGFSGVSYYEIKIVPKTTVGQSGGTQEFFVEATPPYFVGNLDIGNYDIIVRAYDNASPSNAREVTQDLRIVKPFFIFITFDGLQLPGGVIVPWIWFFLVMTLLILSGGYWAWLVKHKHLKVDSQLKDKELPQDVKEKLRELQEYKEKYEKTPEPKLPSDGSGMGKIVAFLLVAISASLLIVGGGLPAQAQTNLPVGALAQAQQEEATQGSKIEIAPPVITTFSRNISNEEIFYLGGNVETAQMEVVIFLQNLKTGETTSRRVLSDQNRRWFYRHDSFLSQGEYMVWVQSRLGEQTSPPSPQVQLEVSATALQIGASRLSYEFLYLMLTLILSGIAIGLLTYILHHRRHLLKKHALLSGEIQEAEESIKRGFALLRRDIQAELDIIDKLKLNKGLTQKHKEQEEQLLKDLENIESKIGKEIWDIEQTEQE